MSAKTFLIVTIILICERCPSVADSDERAHRGNRDNEKQNSIVGNDFIHTCNSNLCMSAMELGASDNGRDAMTRIGSREPGGNIERVDTTARMRGR